MIKHLWAFLTGDRAPTDGFARRADDGFTRYLYSREMIDQVNRKRRYQILTNRAQTDITVVDTQYRQRVAKLYDISYAFLVADALNSDSRDDDELL